MSEASERPTSLGPDFFGLSAREVADLLSSSSPLTIPIEANARENGNVQGRKTNKQLFRDTTENTIPEEKRELLKALLRRTVNTLTKEFEEIQNPVKRIQHILSLLRMKKRGSCVQGSDGQESKEKPSKRMKKLSDIGKCTCSGNRRTLQIAHKNGVKVCEACGLMLGDEEQLSQDNNTGRGFLNSPKSRSEDEDKEVDQNLKFLLEYPDSLLVEERIQKQSEELSTTLDYMEKCLGNILDTTVSHLRPMSHQEKRRLGIFIQKLPPEDRVSVAEMVSQKEGGTSNTDSNSLQFYNELYKLDKSTLWRLYFHVKAVERAKNLSLSKR